MKTKRQKTEVRREQIAEAALAIISSQGMKALTVARVAKMLGLATSALYRHFSSKDEILEAVLALLGQRMAANIDAACAETENGLGRLHALLTRHVRLVLEVRVIPRILFSDEIYGTMSGKSRFSLFAQDLRGRIQSIVELGQARGEIRNDFSAEDIAIMFLGVFVPPAIYFHASGGEFDIVTQVHQSWRLFVDAVRSDSGTREER